MTFWRGARFVSIGTVLLTPVSVFAQAALNQKIVSCTGVNCTVCDLASTAQNVLNTGIYLMIVLSAVMFAWAGFEALTAAGSTEKYGKAKRIFSNVVIGLVIILASWLVIDTLMRTLVGNGSGFGKPWNKICELVESAFERHYA